VRAWTQLGRQAVLAVAGIAYPFVMTWIILWVTDHTVGLRVSPGEEAEGLDLGEHGEVAHQLAADMTSAGMAVGSGLAARSPTESSLVPARAL
jgi:Amt family ammonium transporter